MHTINIRDAQEQLPRLVERAAQGKAFIIAKGGKPMVKVYTAPKDNHLFWQTRRTRPALFLLLAALAVQAPAALAKQGTIDSWCDQLGTRLRSVSADACRTQDFVAAPDRTSQGNALVMRDIGAKDNIPPGDSKRILVIGGIHGDELTSVSTVFRWLKWTQQPDAALYQWRMIPVANPDGLVARPSAHDPGGQSRRPGGAAINPRQCQRRRPQPQFPDP